MKFSRRVRSRRTHTRARPSLDAPTRTMSAATAAGSKGFSAQPGSATGATTPFATVNVSPFLWCATRATLPSPPSAARSCFYSPPGGSSRASLASRRRGDADDDASATAARFASRPRRDVARRARARARARPRGRETRRGGPDAAGKKKKRTRRDLAPAPDPPPISSHLTRPSPLGVPPALAGRRGTSSPTRRATTSSRGARTGGRSRSGSRTSSRRSIFRTRSSTATSRRS